MNYKEQLAVKKDEIIQQFGKENNMNEIERILTATCKVLQLDPKEVLKRCRKRELVEARQITIYIAKLKTKCSLNKIGAFFCTFKNPKGYDHATIHISAKVVNNLIDTNSELECGLKTRDAIEQILDELKTCDIDSVISGQYDKSIVAKVLLGYTVNK
jgi:chromosomal replication initiation ATPase DnaA